MITAKGNLLIITLGKLTVSGTKSALGRYENPKAEVEIYEKDLSVNIQKGITKIIFQAKFEYKEATTRKDKPNFLLTVNKDGRKFAEARWSDPDIMNRFEQHSGELSAEVDLKKYFSETEKVVLDFDFNLECWLDESSWLSEGAGKKTVSASDVAHVRLHLPKAEAPDSDPEVLLEIVPTTSPATHTHESAMCINADWGQPMFFNLWLDNKFW